MGFAKFLFPACSHKMIILGEEKETCDPGVTESDREIVQSVVDKMISGFPLRETLTAK